MLSARVVAAPLKVGARLADGDNFAKDTTDILRYTLTGKEKNNDMDGFLDFDDED